MKHLFPGLTACLLVASLAQVTPAAAAEKPGEPAMPASRILLESDTLHIGLHGSGSKATYPEDIMPPAVLRAAAQHLKIDLKTQGIFWGDYCYFAGMTGEAFRFMEFMNLGEPLDRRPLVERYGNITAADMYRHALDAAGLPSRSFSRPFDKAALQREIVQSLRDRQTPIIGLGAFGMPQPFLVTGFDEGGEVLLGWSHLQNEAPAKLKLTFDAGGQFRLRNWADTVDSFIILGAPGNKPALRDLYAAAMERGVRELRSTEGHGPLGPAAMEKWAAHLESEPDFAGFSAAQWQKAHQDHSTTAGDLAERRALAGDFMRLAQRVFPEAQEDLATAAASSWGAHDTVYEIWETVARTGPFDPDIEKFRDPARRKVLAALVRRLPQLDRRSADAMERALQLIRGQKPAAALPPDPALDGTFILQKAAAPAPKPIFAPENIAIANSAVMLKQFLGASFGPLTEAEAANPKIDYVLAMGFSGAAFGQLDDTPDRANLPLLFDALGYDYELWMPSQLAQATGLPARAWGWDDNLRRRIYWNLRDRKLPVLLFDCGPWPNWWLITQSERYFGFRGYGGGEGYRPNEPLDDPKNPLRAVDLMAGMKGHQTWTLNLLARRAAARPPMEDLYRRAVAWGARKLAAPQLTLLGPGGQEFLSNQPFRDWAEMMKTDSLFPADDPQVLQQRRQWLLGREVELAERRHYGAAFLALAATRLARPQLQQAANHFEATNKLMERIWAKAGGPQAPGEGLPYAQRSTREAIAELLLEAQREEAAAQALLAAAARDK